MRSYWTWAISRNVAGHLDKPTLQQRASRRVPLTAYPPLRITTRTCSSLLGRRCNPFGAVNPLRSKEDFSKRVFRSRQTDSSGTMQELPVPVFPIDVHAAPHGT